MGKKKITKKELIEAQERESSFSFVKPQIITPVKQNSDLDGLEIKERIIWVLVKALKKAGLDKTNVAKEISKMQITRQSIYNIYARACEKIERRRGR